MKNILPFAVAIIISLFVGLLGGRFVFPKPCKNADLIAVPDTIYQETFIDTCLTFIDSVAIYNKIREGKMKERKARKVKDSEEMAKEIIEGSDTVFIYKEDSLAQDTNQYVLFHEEGAITIIDTFLVSGNKLLPGYKRKVKLDTPVIEEQFTKVIVLEKSHPVVTKFLPEEVKYNQLYLAGGPGYTDNRFTFSVGLGFRFRNDAFISLTRFTDCPECYQFNLGIPAIRFKGKKKE